MCTADVCDDICAAAVKRAMAVECMSADDMLLNGLDSLCCCLMDVSHKECSSISASTQLTCTICQNITVTLIFVLQAEPVRTAEERKAAEQQIFNLKEAFERLSRELGDMLRHPPTGILVQAVDDDVYQWLVKFSFPTTCQLGKVCEALTLTSCMPDTLTPGTRASRHAASLLICDPAASCGRRCAAVADLAHLPSHVPAGQGALLNPFVPSGQHPLRLSVAVAMGLACNALSRMPDEDSVSGCAALLCPSRTLTPPQSIDLPPMWAVLWLQRVVLTLPQPSYNSPCAAGSGQAEGTTHHHQPQLPTGSPPLLPSCPEASGAPPSDWSPGSLDISSPAADPALGALHAPCPAAAAAAQLPAGVAWLSLSSQSFVCTTGFCTAQSHPVICALLKQHWVPLLPHAQLLQLLHSYLQVWPGWLQFASALNNLQSLC